MHMTYNRPTRALTVAGVLLAVAGLAFWLGRGPTDSLPALPGPKAMPLTSGLALGAPSEARLEGSSRTGATWTAMLSVPGEPSE